MEQNIKVVKFRPWKPAEKSTVQHASLAVKTPRNTCGSSVRSLSRIIRTHEPGPASDGCNEVWNPSASRGSTHEMEISSKPRGSTVRWLLWRWPCQAKSDPVRCTASGLAQMRVPCGNTSSQANLPGISCSEPTAYRFSVPASKTKKRPQQKLTQFWPNKCSMKNSESQSSQHSQAMRSSESSVKYRPKTAQNLGMKQLIVTTTATRHPDLMVNTSLDLKSLNDRRKSWPLISTPGLSSDTYLLSKSRKHQVNSRGKHMSQHETWREAKVPETFQDILFKIRFDCKCRIFGPFGLLIGTPAKLWCWLCQRSLLKQACICSVNVQKSHSVRKEAGALRSGTRPLPFLIALRLVIRG